MHKSTASELSLQDFQRRFQALYDCDETGLTLTNAIAEAQAAAADLGVRIKSLSGTKDLSELRQQSQMLKAQSRLIILVSRSLMKIKKARLREIAC